MKDNCLYTCVTGYQLLRIIHTLLVHHYFLILLTFCNTDPQHIHAPAPFLKRYLCSLSFSNINTSAKKELFNQGSVNDRDGAGGGLCEQKGLWQRTCSLQVSSSQFKIG